MLGYFPADLAVLDPERTDGGIGAGNGEAGVRHGMGEAGGGLRKFTVGINGLEFTLDAQIKYLA